MSVAVHCRKKGCGARMEERWVLAGKLVWVCPPCRLNALGLCRDCRSTMENPRAFRCEACRMANARERDNARHRRRYRNDAGFRAESGEARRRRYHARRDEECARKRAKYRERGPRKRDAFDLVYHREWNRRKRQDPKVREAQNAARRKRWATDPEYRAARNAEGRERRRRARERRMGVAA